MLSNHYAKEVAFSLRKFHQLKPPSERITNKSLIKRVFLEGKDKILDLLHKKMRKNIYTP
jgi:hypothetical protein